MVVYASTVLLSSLEAQHPTDTLKHCCLSFCSYLFERTMGWRQNPDDGILYSSALGKRIYTQRNYDTMIALLKRIGAVEQVGNYRVGEKPKAYRLNAAFRNDATRRVIDAPKLEKRLRRALHAEVPMTPVRRWLEDVYLHHTQFAPNVRDILDNHPYESLHQLSCFHYHYEQFHNRSRLYTVARTGRISYVPNLLPKQLRGAILIDGEPMVEVDVTASQPRLALGLLPPNSPDHKGFASLLDSGELYEIAARWAEHPEWTHDEAKQRFFAQVMYGPLYGHRTSLMWMEIARRYPTLAEVICKEKRRDERVFPIKLQTLEARIMIDGVVTECVERQIPVIAIHDGVGTKAQHVDEVAGMIERHWTAATGHPPMMKVGGKRWSASRAPS